MNKIEFAVPARYDRVTVNGLEVTDKKEQAELILTAVRAAIIRKYGFTRFNGVELGDVLKQEILIGDSRLGLKLPKPEPTETLASYAGRCKADVNSYLAKSQAILQIPNFLTEGTRVINAIQMPELKGAPAAGAEGAAK